MWAVASTAASSSPQLSRRPEVASIRAGWPGSASAAARTSPATLPAADEPDRAAELGSTGLSKVLLDVAVPQCGTQARSSVVAPANTSIHRNEHLRRLVVAASTIAPSLCVHMPSRCYRHGEW